MQYDADRVVQEVLRADDGFLIEIGRLTLLFSRIEDVLVHDALELANICSTKAEEVPVSSSAVKLRILEKRDLVKRMVVGIGNYYGVDDSRLLTRRSRNQTGHESEKLEPS